MDEQRERISVSRDTLRAELAEMELRLKSYISMELDKKAGVEIVKGLTDNLEKVKAGEFSPAMLLAIQDQIDKNWRGRVKANWSTKEKVMAFVTVTATVITLIFTAIYTIHTLKPVSIHTPTTDISKTP